MKTKKHDGSLAIFSRGAAMLAEADTIQKAKELKSLALTAADWARRKSMGEDTINHCRSYALEAERKMGEMLARAEKAKGGRPEITGRATRPVKNAPTLADLGLTKDESAKAQILAKLPATLFNKVKDGRESRASAIRKARGKPKPVARPIPPDDGDDDGPEDTPQVIWRRGLCNRAEDSLGLAMYEDWSQFKVDLELVEVALRVSEKWKELATYLRKLYDEQKTKA